jgi:ComF family protein
VLFQEPVCAGCGIPLDLAICHCSDMMLGLTQIRSLGPFAGWLREAILSFKYEEEWARADHLGRNLARVVATVSPVDALLPVPLHRSRLRARGYNQSGLLARVAGEVLDVRVVDGLIRTRATAQQTRLTAAERAANVAGAFAVSPGFDPAGRSIVLIDDVVTTGSTLNACAHLLSVNGAAVVRAATLARQL